MKHTVILVDEILSIVNSVNALAEHMKVDINLMPTTQAEYSRIHAAAQATIGPLTYTGVKVASIEERTEGPAPEAAPTSDAGVSPGPASNESDRKRTLDALLKAAVQTGAGLKEEPKLPADRDPVGFLLVIQQDGIDSHVVHESFDAHHRCLIEARDQFNDGPGKAVKMMGGNVEMLIRPVFM